MIETVINAPAEFTRDELIAAAIHRLEKLLPAEALKEEQFKLVLSSGIDQIRSPWFRFFMTHEPGPVLEKVSCPVLALNGERDVQVDPRLNLPAIHEALEKGGNKQSAAVEMPGLNHLFQTCSTGGLSEYRTIEETISPVVLQKITEWIRQTSIQRD